MDSRGSEVLGLRPAERVRYAASDIWFRKGSVFWNVTAVALAVGYITLLGHYGTMFYRYQQSVLDESLPTLVVAQCPELTAEKLFTDQRLGEIGATDHVALAYPKVEIGVRISLAGRPPVMVPAEGTVARNPALTENRLVWGRPMGEEAADQVIVGESLFTKLGGRIANGQPVPDRLSLQVSRTVGGQEQVLRRELKLAGLARFQRTDKAYLPLALAVNLDQWCSNKIKALSDNGRAVRDGRSDYPCCYAYVPEGYEDRLASEARGLRITAQPAGRVQVPELPERLWAAVDGDNKTRLTIAQVKARLGKKASADMYAVFARTFQTPALVIQMTALTAEDPRWQLTAAGKVPSPGQVVAKKSGKDLRAFLESHKLGMAGVVDCFPEEGDLFCSLDTLKILTRTAPTTNREIAAVHLADNRQWRRWQTDLLAVGLSLRPLTIVREETLLRYRITDAQTAGGRVDTRLMALIAMAKPTFRQIMPYLATDVTVEDQPFSLAGTLADDPERFAEELAAGTWMEPKGSDHGIILPAAIAGKLYGSAAKALGKVLTVHLVREQRISTAEPALDLALKVMGVVRGSEGFAAMGLVENLAAWHRGEVFFNETRRTFESPREIYQRRGFIRANVFAADAAAVAGVVAQLERNGYQTQHSLAEQEGLRKLGRILVFIVGFFVLGCVVNAAISVLISTTLNIRSKRYEIGILRAHGLGTRDILGIFGLQGLLIGLAAFAAGVAMITLIEPSFRTLVGRTFHLPLEVIVTRSIWSPSMWWLLALALLVAVGFSLAGVVLPGYAACQGKLVDLLGSRE